MKMRDFVRMVLEKAILSKMHCLVKDVLGKFRKYIKDVYYKQHEVNRHPTIVHFSWSSKKVEPPYCSG